ncbi:MAG: hypothetical protein ACLFUS_17620 [Candidatus Sumerlaeia bacterium]
MKRFLFIPLFFLLVCPVFAGQTTGTIHVFVALCDNENQAIVKVRPALGRGDDPDHNLYWGAYYGVRNYFTRSNEWELLATMKEPRKGVILERCVFKHRDSEVRMVADAYKGSEIKTAIGDFLDSAAGTTTHTISVYQEKPGLLWSSREKLFDMPAHGSADLLIYVGHNGLMDFDLESYPEGPPGNPREAAILACSSYFYFREAIEKAGADPILWTTGLMAPEAYVVEAAMQGWMTGESDEVLHERVAQAYMKFQHCGIGPARRLFRVGF